MCRIQTHVRFDMIRTPRRRWMAPCTPGSRACLSYTTKRWQRRGRDLVVMVDATSACLLLEHVDQSVGDRTPLCHLYLMPRARGHMQHVALRDMELLSATQLWPLLLTWQPLDPVHSLAAE